MKKVLMPVAAFTPILVMVLSIVLLAPATAFSQNDGPPAGALLDLSGTPIPGGGNGSYQMYSVAFVAGQSNTPIMFAFRDDPADISFTNATVTDLTNPSSNLLLNGSFTSGTGSAPTSWTYANGNSAANGGVVGSNSNDCYAYLSCWYDGALQAYDTISQTIATNIGDTYLISFYVAEDSRCLNNGGGATCNFSQRSTNGDTTDDGGNGIDVVVYAQGGTLATQQLTVTLLDPGNGQVTDNTGAMICTEAAGVVEQKISGTPTVETTATCTATYDYGTVVTLTEAANEPTASSPVASSFAGWGGACASATKSECTLTMNSSQNATAAFAIPGQTVTLPANPGSTQTYGFNQGAGQTPYDLTVLNNTTNTTFGVTVNPISTSQSNCNTIIDPSFPGANCFVYQLGASPAVPPDSAVMFEVTCPSSPGGTCGSAALQNFLATLGSDFTFSVPAVGPQENSPLFLAGYPSNAPTYGPLQAQGLADPNPYVGFLKGVGPDPLHPCTPFTPADNPLNNTMFSNQIVAFILGDTSGKGSGGSGSTGSCWLVSYLTSGETPTVSFTQPANNGLYQQGETDSTTTTNYTCTAVNAGSSSLTGPYLTVASCSATDSPGGSVAQGAQFDTGTIGPHTFTATVVDSATNTASSTVTYYVLGSQTITFATPASAAYGSSFNVAATGGASGNPVTFTSGGSCSGSGSGSATITMTSGTGTCSVTANQAGNNTSYAAATQVTQNVTAMQATPTATLSVSNSPVTYTGSAQAATVVVSTSSVPGAVSNILYNGLAAVPTTAGSYTVTANFVPTDTTDYNTLTSLPAGSFVIKAATPTATLSVNNSPVTYTGSAQAATVVVSTSSVPGAVSNILYNGLAAVPTTAGSYTVTANFVPTDTTDYNTLTSLPAGSFVIKAATPTATLSVNNSPVTYTGSAQAATVVVSTSSVPGAVSNILYNGLATVPTTAGSYTVTANFVPTDTTDYNTLTSLPAGSFVIKAATPTATLSVNNSPVTYTGSAQAATVVVSTSSVPGAVSNILYNGLATVPTTAGSYTVTANFVPTDTTDYNTLTSLPAGNFVIKQATQTITFTSTPPSPWVVGGAIYTPTTTGGASGNAVTFSLDPASTGCTVSGSGFAPSAVGTCVIDANQAGNTNYLAAPQKQQSIPVTAPPTPLISFSPSSLNFGTMKLGTVSSLTVVVSNPGTASLTITKIAMLGNDEDNDLFTITNNCKSAVAPKGTCSFAVKASASELGVLALNLGVTDNVTGSPQAIPISVNVVRH